jgi:hypothetical protein
MKEEEEKWSQNIYYKISRKSRDIIIEHSFGTTEMRTLMPVHYSRISCGVQSSNSQPLFLE